MGYGVRVGGWVANGSACRMALVGCLTLLYELCTVRFGTYLGW